MLVHKFFLLLTTILIGVIGTAGWWFQKDGNNKMRLRFTALYKKFSSLIIVIFFSI